MTDPLTLALKTSLEAHKKTRKLLYWCIGLLITILLVKSGHLIFDLWNTLKVAPENRGIINEKLDEIKCFVNPADMSCKHTVSFLMPK